MSVKEIADNILNMTVGVMLGAAGTVLFLVGSAVLAFSLIKLALIILP